MEATIERQDGVLVARVSGRIEPANAQALESTITASLQNGDRAVILDTAYAHGSGSINML